MCVDTQDPLQKKNLQNKAFMSVKKKTKNVSPSVFLSGF